mgnify:CR=1 FL=1
MAYYDEEHYSFYYAAFGLTGFTFIASAVISGVALCTVRRRSDIARSWIPYYKAAFSIFAFALFLRCLTYALSVAQINMPYSSGYTNESMLVEASAYMSTVGEFFSYIAEILIFLTLIVLGCCVTIAQCGQKQTPDRFVKYVAYGFSGLIGILVLVHLSLNCAAFSYVYKRESSYDYDSYATQEKIAKLNKSTIRIMAAASILFMIAALGALVWSIIVTIRGPKNQGASSTPAILLIVCSALFLLNKVYDMAILFRYSYPKERDYPEHMRIVGVVFDVWPEFVLLVILFALGIKKRSGVWTNRDLVDAQLAPQDMAYGYHGQPQFAPQQQYYVQQPAPQYQQPVQHQQHPQYLTEQKLDQQPHPQSPQQTHQQYTHQSQELSSQAPVYTHGAT